VASFLKRRYSCNSPVDLFIGEARRLQRKSRIHGPPFDPRDYARSLGIRVVEREGMGLDGQLRPLGDGTFLIEVKEDATVSRKNFTIAHELGHTFFYDLLAKLEHRRGAEGSDLEEERLCDLAAAELLMPEEDFKRDLANGGPVSPDILLNLSQRYCVSLSAAATRVAWLTGDIACALWRLEHAAVGLQWITPRWMGRLVLCQTGGSSIEEASKTLGKVVTRIDSFYREDGRRLRRETSSLGLSSRQMLSVISVRAPKIVKGHSRIHSGDGNQATPPSKATNKDVESTGMQRARQLSLGW
jgi:uncharacterized protein DUF955